MEVRRSVADRLVIVIGCLVPLVAGCVVTPAPTPSPTPTPTLPPTPEPTATGSPLHREIQVLPDEVHQTLKDVVGGDFVHRFGGVHEPLDPVSRYTLEHIGPRYARVNMTLEDWEPVNDDADPETFQWDGFKEAGYIPATFGFLETIQARGGGLVASAWDVPDWMVTDPEAEQPRHLDPGLYPEVAESIAAWLLRARDDYGVTVDYVSFNEATLGVNIVLTPDEYAALIAVAGPRFETLGLPTRWLLGDCHNMTVCARYVREIYAHEEIRPYLGPLAFHSWDANTIDSALTDMADFARENGLDIWCTEGGWNSQLWKTPNLYPMWYNAISLATVYSRVLKLSGATVLLYWQMMGTDYQINDGTEGFPIAMILQQYAEQFPEGTQIVGTTPDRTKVYALAGQAPEHFVVQLVNGNPIPVPVDVTGLPSGTYAYLRSSDSEGVGTLVATYEVTDGHVALELPRSSVNVLTTRPVAPAPGN